MPLRDALAAALHESACPIKTDGTPAPDIHMWEHRGYASRILSDPAFREALVEAVQDGLGELYRAQTQAGGIPVEFTSEALAHAIVDRMLGGMSEREEGK